MNAGETAVMSEPEYNVYHANPAGGLGFIAKASTWREANVIRRQIAIAALRTKDNSFPVVYDRQGNWIVSDWQKGQKP